VVIYTFALVVGTKQPFPFIFLPLHMIRPQVINIIAHVAGWLLFFSLFVGFVTNSWDNTDIAAKLFSPEFLIFYFVFLFLFYFNVYVLIPRLYLKKKYLVYFAIILALFVGVYFLKPFDRLMVSSRPPHERGDISRQRRDQRPPPPGPGFSPEGRDQGPPPPRFSRLGRDRRPPVRTDITSMILFITVWSLSTALCIIKQWRLTEQRVAKAEADKANAELSFLKAQINPHFLFNTLNNIYSLALTNNENTAASIMKLSNIMRYVTDDIGEDFVPLENEIQCMTDYIDLQRLRLGKTMNVDLFVSGPVADKKIAPLILMTFVENVFKYGISNHEPAAITIKLSVEGNRINFYCLNKLFETKRNVERSGTGIGISNTKQRLQHLYPGKHSLKIDTSNGYYTVQLTLDTNGVAYAGASADQGRIT
jgi:two-component system, LytTR family, sensor kinase